MSPPFQPWNDSHFSSQESDWSSEQASSDITSSHGSHFTLKTVYSEHSITPSVTYGGQSKLQRLPIPTLDETLDKFPKVLEAIQDEEEREETSRVVEEFRSGVGPLLQKALVEYEKAGFESGTLGSYVEEFWNESYLAPKDSVVLNLNPFFVLEGGVRHVIIDDRSDQRKYLTAISNRVICSICL